MAYSNKAILVDVNGKPIPQIWDEARDQFVPYEGNVTLSGRNAADLATRGYESTYVQRQGQIAANSEEILFSASGRECHLEALALGTNARNMGLRFMAAQANGVFSGTGALKIPASDGSYVTDITLRTLQHNWNGENDFFRNFVYDEENGRFAMGMKRQAVFANGVQIAVRNWDAASPRNAAISMLVAQWRA